LYNCWQFSMKRVSRQGVWVNIPELHAIHAVDIHESVLVFKEKPGLCESWDGKRRMVSKGPMQRVVPYVSIVRHLGCMSLWCLPANGTKQNKHVYTNSCY
jgi:hypothetical protein